MKKCFLLFIVCGVYCLAGAQSAKELYKQAEVLRKNYQFKEASAIFSAIIKQNEDSTLIKQAAQQLLFCENGQIMLQYIEKPVVTGLIRVPRENFFNYYDIDFGGTWALLPDTLLSAQNNATPISPVFIPANGYNTLYFSSPKSGNWDIYVIRRIDRDNWSAPEALSVTINTPFDERFPYVTPDGKTLYFSSNGHSGMGGYDLYRSTFNENTQEWSTPENLGFPYSSPYDDWLFVPTVDQTSALFASSREQHTDSLTIYRIAMEANPIKQSRQTIQEIRQIAQLKPANDHATNEAIFESNAEPNNEYVTLRKMLQQQQKQEQDLQNKLTAARKNYHTATDRDERIALQQTIIADEQQLMQLQATISQTKRQVQQAEQKLLEQGITVETAIPVETYPPEMVSLPAFLPKYKPLAAFPSITIAPPAPTAEELASDYIFRVGKTVEVFYNPPMPGGLIYRIQIGKLSRKLAAPDFKGLSPGIIDPDKKLYTHYVGQFSTYSEANKAVPEVKRKFRETIIVPFLNGKKITLKEAREYEAKQKENRTYKLVLGEYPEGLPALLRQTVQDNTANDIAKATSSGRTVFIVGPFNSEAEVKMLHDLLKSKGFDTIIE